MIDTTKQSTPTEQTPRARRHLRTAHRAPRRFAIGLGAALLGLVPPLCYLLGGARAGTLPPRIEAPPGAFPFATYDQLLKRYTDEEGRVDYAALRARDADTVERLYASIAATGPDKTPALYKGRDAALAYYLSAYNVLVWKNVIDQWTAKGPASAKLDAEAYRFFRQPEFQVDGREVDLDDLEKKIIRPRFKEPRVHFALNCASGGCPRLPRDAFTPAKVQAQLDKEARRFIMEPRNVSYDAAQRRLRLSSLFKWYREDFTPATEAGVLAFVNRHRPADAQIPAGVSIEYVDYDWRINDPSLRRAQ